MKKKTLYLHVGMDKTGTSAIQYFLYKNRDKIESQIGLCYPITGLWNDYSHHPFAFSIVEMMGFSLKDITLFFETMMSEVRNSENVILSSECLFKTPTNGGFNKFFELVSEHFQQIKVIVYVRRQDEWVESRHKHSIISGNELTLEVLMRPHFCNYMQYIDQWANIFGAANVIVKAYENKQFRGGSIYSDFMHIFGLAVTGQYEMPDALINVSLGFDEMVFKRFCNNIGFTGRYVDILNGLLIEHTNTKPSLYKSKYLLSPSVRLDLVNRYSDINRSIAAYYLERYKGDLFFEPLPDPASAWEQPCMSDERMAGIGQFILKSNPEMHGELKHCAKEAAKSADPSIAEAGYRLFRLL